MIQYQSDLEGINAKDLTGFFVGWPSPPSGDQLHQILSQVPYKVISKCNRGQVIGFVYAISDGMLSAYIPLIEVIPRYQNQGVGKQLLEKILHLTEHLYMVDLCCDPNLAGYYKRLGFSESVGMIRRNYKAFKT